MAKILLVDDNPQNIELLSLRLEAAGHSTLEARDGEQALKLIAEQLPDLMILDMQMPKVDGLQVLKALREDRTDLPVVVISAFATVERAVEAMKAGALDFITKPFDPTHLELVVERALERNNLEAQNRFLTEELNARYHFVMGQSAGMEKAYERMLRASANEAPVLIQGESGTGKEIAARVIHRESERRGGPFVTIRCGALAPDMQEAELFGTPERKAKVELAAGGVLFLDEVGKLGAPCQARLETLLSTHGFTRTGGSTTIPADVRVIGTTTTDLDSLVAAGSFSAALNELFSAAHVVIPPLRERKDDIPELVSYFVEKYNREVGRPLTGVSDSAMDALTAYHWAGNVRELANIIERAVTTGADEQIEMADLGIAVRGMVGASPSGMVPLVGTYSEQLVAARRNIIMGALRDAEGDMQKAAVALELTPVDLNDMLTELGIRKT
ncbi:MAG: sigma-54 dependent transcriptional regulator [Nitrospirota bacterium]|nr:sigma-54 dependent transcriptional regulator [Nitrospirota bacterium]